MVLRSTSSSRSCEQTAARLYLNGVAVGEVFVRGHDDSWGFGDFSPLDAFSTFALTFGRWSLLMHADGIDERLSQAASEELREAERELDAFRAELLIVERRERRPLRQVNIDGPLIEWKE